MTKIFLIQVFNYREKKKKKKKKKKVITFSPISSVIAIYGIIINIEF